MLSNDEYEAIKAEAISASSPESAADTLSDDAIVPEETVASPEEESAAQITSEANEETPAAVTEEEVESDDTASTESEVSDVETLSDALPSADEINTKWNRVPKEAREEMIRFVDEARNYREQIDTLGGEQAVNILKPLADIFQKADTTVDERIPVTSALLNANPTTMLNLMADGMEAFLLTPELRGWGNKVLADTYNTTVEEIGDYSALKRDFGDKADASHIKELLTLEKAGFIDPEADMETFRANFGGSEVFEQQQEAIRTLTEQLRDAKENPQQQAKAEPINTQAVVELDTEFDKRFEASTSPARDMAKWKKDSYLDQIVSKAIRADLKSDPDYKTAVDVVKQTGFVNLDHFAITPALNRLALKARGRYQEAAKHINAELRGQSETSHNTAQKAKAEEVTKPKAEKLPESTSNTSWRSPNKELDDIWADFHGTISDARAQAARSA